MTRKYDIQERLGNFTDDVHNTLENILSRNPMLNAVISQLARSSLSCSNNYCESTSAESVKDFIHKLRVVLKEVRESKSSLGRLKNNNKVKDKTIILKLINECDQLIAIIYTSIETTKRNHGL